MIITGEKAPSRLETDVCIVGSGPAGLSVALELERRGIHCVLLESGNREPDQAHNALNETAQTGITTDHNTVNRLRGLGGTSTHWGGLVRPLDALDFERRDWVPHSGWPISHATLAPYYATAHRLLGFEADQYDLAEVEGPRARSAHTLSDPDFENVAFQHDQQPIRLGQQYFSQLADSTRITTCLDATVTQVNTDETATRATSLSVSTLDGRPFEVSAKRVVLAAGAIQNARLLLNANTVAPAGLGNRHGNVGRYFMQHPVLYGTRLLVWDASLRNRLRRSGVGQTAIRTAIRPEAARRHQLLNFHLFPLRPQSPGRRETLLRKLPGGFRQLLRGSQVAQVGDVGEVPEYVEALQHLLSPGASVEPRYVPLEVRAEQVPNHASRITLGETRDALGVPQAVMDWQLTGLDQQSLHRGLRLFGGCVARQGLGRVQAGANQLRLPEAPGQFLHGGNHHYGTTRMGESESDSVVNSDCRVHRMTNLYVAGSGVFPTTGHANPTLTVVALSARLAAHLSSP